MALGRSVLGLVVILVAVACADVADPPADDVAIPTTQSTSVDSTFAASVDEPTSSTATVTSSSSTTSTSIVTTTSPSPVGDIESGLFCRDLFGRGYGYSEAVAYWTREGQPDRMDADRNGIPCETVYDRAEVLAFWGDPLPTTTTTTPDLVCGRISRLRTWDASGQRRCRRLWMQPRKRRATGWNLVRVHRSRNG